MTDASRLQAYGFDWPGDLTELSNEYLESQRAAQILPRIWSDDQRKAPPFGLIGRDLREIAAARIFGTGVEIGALASPYPAPVHCSVLYGDLFTHTELLKSFPNEPADDMVIPTLKTEFETLAGINEGSLDFVLASHVIEHTRDPIGAIANAYAKLRAGGSLVLVIPDMRRTFDKGRALTSLSHLIEDFKAPSHDRDAEHHREFHSLAFPAPQQDYEGRWRRSWDARKPIHYHTWIYEAFAEMIAWIVQNVAPFKEIWSHPTLPRDPEDFEFYFTLVK